MAPRQYVPKLKSRWRSLHLADTWIWEELAAGISLASMAAIVTVLAVYNGRDATRWAFPYNITLNAIIAALNTLGKSLLTFALSAAIGQWKWITANQRPSPLKTFGYIDRASRGPLGSVQLLWDMNV